MLEQKIKNGLVTMALALGASGCGATLQHQDSGTNVWYECRTNDSYPENHPCYQVVQSYLAAQRSSSSSSSSGSNKDNDKTGYDKGDRSNSEKSGSSERSTGGHWEKPN